MRDAAHFLQPRFELVERSRRNVHGTLRDTLHMADPRRVAFLNQCLHGIGGEDVRLLVAQGESGATEQSRYQR